MPCLSPSCRQSGRTISLAPVIEWLLDSDPAIRWQVMRDLLDAPESEWTAERSKVATEGWGARLLSHQDSDGQWAGGAFIPSGFTAQMWEEEGQPFTATLFSLTQLREFGLEPSSAWARHTTELIGAHSRWDHAGQPYWEGEVEECINGRVVADGAYFGVDVSHIVERLVGERLEDGGWNCERTGGSVRSSFDSTINVLEGLLEYERATGGTHEAREARESGEEFLLERNLFRRLSTGKPAHDRFLDLTYPSRSQYDVLRGLDYFRSASQLTGADPDPRLSDAIDHLRLKRREDGIWNLDWSLPGRVWFSFGDNPGSSSKWITLRAARVLRWWNEV